MKDLIKKALRIRKVLMGKDFYASNQISIKKEKLGAENACFTIHAESLNNDSVIYSFGVGTDISFDLALMQKFHCKVHAFDPTPKSIKWVKEKGTPKNFIFHPFGLAGKSGKLDLYLPENENHVSGSLLSDMLSSHSKTTVDVYDLPSVMKSLGHQRIDILKMDIEGSEYEVIQNIIENQLDIKQILVEFHHRFKNIGIKKTKSAICVLNEAGYRIFDISPSGEEFSFIRV